MRRVSFRWRFPRQRSHWVALVAGILIAARLWHWRSSSPREFDFQSRGPYHVVGVDEAGTLQLEGKIPLWLIGLDAGPDKKPFAGQAAESVRSRVEGRDVSVEFDRERRDREGRILAYVYADGTLLNEELLRTGLARADTNSDIERSMATRFRRAQDEARRAGRGLWGIPAVSAR